MSRLLVALCILRFFRALPLGVPWSERRECYRRALRPLGDGDISACWPSPFVFQGSQGGGGENAASLAGTSWEDPVEIFDAEDEALGHSVSAWEAQTSCKWHRTAYVIPVLPDGQILFQRRAAWKWRMGGLLDIGVSETVEVGESYEDAAFRAITEELGSKASLEGMAACCNVSFLWRGSMPKMRVCQADHNRIFRARAARLGDLGDRDAEVEALLPLGVAAYEAMAAEDALQFAPWVHAITTSCPRCFVSLGQDEKVDL
eukprot:TRINITY_DN63294_c0_g1_i1.p2 TRINITY_DN63294_c0_g1~~TRINITY_DN63294_c0_g1_i1.p2  ORF type:complete len:260 (+),score=56.17 TRINITY_DN63294_c0_g1_i1:175-954(+)